MVPKTYPTLFKMCVNFGDIVKPQGLWWSISGSMNVAEKV